MSQGRCPPECRLLQSSLALCGPPGLQGQDGLACLATAPGDWLIHTPQNPGTRVGGRLPLSSPPCLHLPLEGSQPISVLTASQAAQGPATGPEQNLPELGPEERGCRAAPSTVSWGCGGGGLQRPGPPPPPAEADTAVQRPRLWGAPQRGVGEVSWGNWGVPAKAPGPREGGWGHGKEHRQEASTGGPVPGDSGGRVQGRGVLGRGQS